MVKFPSVQSMFGQAWSAAKRFPMTTLCALVGTGILIYITHSKWDLDEARILNWTKLIMCCELGLCLFLAAKLFSESRGSNAVKEVLLQAVVLGALVCYYFSIRRFEDFDMVSITRYSIYMIAAHLAVSFAPFIGRNQINGFWQFNKTIFLRFVLTVFYSTVLFGGLALALWLMDELLHIHMSYKRYLYLWYVLGILFNTIFFLAGVPRDMKELDTDTSYPKGLKIFTQFVLIPLVCMYLFIMYAYIAKILFQWSLPKGYVSYLVISFSGLGIFSLLMVYPIRHLDDNKWIKTFSKWFYVALYPLLILLAVNIENRISDYGTTVDRYFIVALALWLVCISAYFLWSKKENIKVIPVSLGVMALLVSFGPWGAFSVSGHSQARRLEKILTAEHILVNGKIHRLSMDFDNFNADTAREINGIVEYLSHSNGLEYIQPWFTQNFDSLKTSRYSYMADDSIMRWMGLHSGYYGSNNSTRYFYAKDNGDGNAVNVSGYDYYSHFEKYYDYRDTNEAPDTSEVTYVYACNHSYSFSSRGANKYVLKLEDKIVATMDFTPFLLQMGKLRDTTDGDNESIRIPNDKFVWEMQVDSVSMKFVFKSIQTEKKGDKYIVQSIDGAVLSKMK
ncbi:MAG TPA: DUF4153 domain-containing protein [Bacteroidia bacterium]|nr:DUF4153 domain-containing protein [Bacteroidia bacterium]